MNVGFIHRSGLFALTLVFVGCSRQVPPQESFSLVGENADFAEYSGQMTVNGSYYRVYEDEMSDGDITCFTPDEPSLRKIAISSLKEGGFCFLNVATANDLLKLNESRNEGVCTLEGDAEIIIADYVVDKHPNHPQDAATIKGVISSTPPVSTPCES